MRKFAFFGCVGVCLLVGVAGLVEVFALASQPRAREIDVSIVDAELPQALASFCDKAEVQLVMEIPPERVQVTLRKGRRATDEVLKELASNAKARLEEDAGIVVLRPDIYPAADPLEAELRHGIEGLIAFLEGLPRASRDALRSEHLLDLANLSEDQRRQVRGALLEGPGRDDSWNTWLSRNRVAVGFLFDPYLEVEEQDNGRTLIRRQFIRAQHVLPRYARLVQGDRPGTYRAAWKRHDEP